MTQNPNMCTPFWEKRPLATPHISMIRGGTSKNSSDSDMGRRPKLKSDEFSEVPPIVVEIISILVEICTEIMGSLIGIWSQAMAPDAAVRHLPCLAPFVLAPQLFKRTSGSCVALFPHQSCVYFRFVIRSLFMCLIGRAFVL